MSLVQEQDTLVTFDRTSQGCENKNSTHQPVCSDLISFETVTNVEVHVPKEIIARRIQDIRSGINILLFFSPFFLKGLTEEDPSLWGVYCVWRGWHDSIEEWTECRGHEVIWQVTQVHSRTLSSFKSQVPLALFTCVYWFTPNVLNKQWEPINLII
jgi:hypothetical protein